MLWGPCFVGDVVVLHLGVGLLLLWVASVVRAIVGVVGTCLVGDVAFMPLLLLVVSKPCGQWWLLAVDESGGRWWPWVTVVIWHWLVGIMNDGGG